MQESVKIESFCELVTNPKLEKINFFTSVIIGLKRDQDCRGKSGNKQQAEKAEIHVEDCQMFLDNSEDLGDMTFNADDFKALQLTATKLHHVQRLRFRNLSPDSKAVGIERLAFISAVECNESDLKEPLLDGLCKDTASAGPGEKIFPGNSFPTVAAAAAFSLPTQSPFLAIIGFAIIFLTKNLA